MPESAAGPPPHPTINKRATPRQATSAVAYVAPPPEDDDPLLAFAPYLHARPRRNSITPELQRRFVSALAATGLVSRPPSLTRGDRARAQLGFVGDLQKALGKRAEFIGATLQL